MKKQVLAFAIAAGISCATAVGQQVVTVTGNITTNTTWSNQNIYKLQGFVYVQNGATLTIEPGSLIKGDRDSKGTLIIERGGKIIADGTAQQPIVFTSNMPIGQRSPGDWGGLVILGNAPVNLPGTPTIEGGISRPYGGNMPADNSGILRYVRVEFPGIAFQPDNEINGITFGGVGSGTIVDYVQVSHCGDDAFEFFGGTVNAKHLIAYKTVDDMFDTDNGYSGTIQFAVGLSDPNVADVSRSNGFESDNDANSSGNTPLTAPKFINVSLFGPKATASTTVNTNFGRGMHIRRNSHLQVYNSVVAGWPTGLLLDGDGAQGGAVMRNMVIAGSTTNALAVQSGSPFDIANWYNTTMSGNEIMTDNSAMMIPDAFHQTTPNFMPAPGSPLHNGGVPVAGADANNFRGAFGNTDWTAGWANWTPENSAYTTTLSSAERVVVDGVKMYPNPATGTTIVSIGEPVQDNAIVDILDMTGKRIQVAYNKIENANGYAVELNVNHLQSGIYLVKVTASGKVFTGRLVITK